MAEKKSGVDSLIDALNASGASTGAKTGQKASSSTSGAKSSNTKKAEEPQQGPAGLGDIPKAILEMPFMERFKNMKKKGKIITAIVVVLILAAAY